MSTPAPSTPPRESPGPPSGPDQSATREGTLRDLFPDEQTGPIFVTDLDLVSKLLAQRELFGLDRKDEFWDGVYVMSPPPNIEHSRFETRLIVAFDAVLPLAGGGMVLADAGVSDRDEGWAESEYRVPDICVYLSANPAQDCQTHMLGGPDLAVEILSHRDPAREKLDFYAGINTREVLLIDREPWALELCRLAAGRLQLVAISTVDKPTPLMSGVLPLAFRLLPGEGRPTLEIAQVGGEQVWRI